MVGVCVVGSLVVGDCVVTDEQPDTTRDISEARTNKMRINRIIDHRPFSLFQNQKPSVSFSDFDDVTLGSSAVFKNHNLRKRRKMEKQVQMGSLRPVAFRPHLPMGLALSLIRNYFVRLPSGVSLKGGKGWDT